MSKMNKNLFCGVVLFAIIFALLKSKVNNGRPNPHQIEIDPHRNQNKTSATNFISRKGIPIHLSTGILYPVLGNSPTIVSHKLTIPKIRKVGTAVMFSSLRDPYGNGGGIK